eukprot:m.40106 g.40106  ORF g.40106 m.40106 type:complete len:355 (-) comp18390_c1_seq1:8-1072(-)
MDAAHLLDVGGSLTIPSFFELAAQKNMNEILSPAIKYLTRVLAVWYPLIFARFLRRADEVALFGEAIIQRHYLRTYAASLAENFYGMKRVPQNYAVDSNDDASPSLTGKQRLTSFVFLVILPYLENKLATLHTSLEREQTQSNSQDPSRSQLSQKLRKLFIVVFPVIRTVWHTSHMVSHVLCLFGRTQSFSPGLWLSGLHLTRLTRSDLKFYADVREQELLSRQTRYLSLPLLRKLFSRSLHGVQDAARIAIPAGIFFMSFMSWWYSSGQANKSKAIAIPPPPKPPVKAREGLTLPEDASLCPICRESRTNPTALAASGLVFCYPCIFKHVERHHRCPVSCVPASIEMLVRIHD